TGALAVEHAVHIEALAEKALSFLEEERAAKQRKERELSAYNYAAQRLIANIIEFLSPYAGLINRVAGTTDLYTAITGPETVTEEINRPGQDPEIRRDFQGRLSTRFWSLLLRGHNGIIDIFLLPSDKVLRLTKVECFYRPVAQMKGKIDGGSVTWEVEGSSLNEEQKRKFFLDLYHELLDRTRTQMMRSNDGVDRRNVYFDYPQPGDSEEAYVPQGFDYRANQPALFGPDDCDSAPDFECDSGKCNAANQHTFDHSQYLLTESDFPIDCRQNTAQVSPALDSCDDEAGCEKKWSSQRGREKETPKSSQSSRAKKSVKAKEGNAPKRSSKKR
ncbi:MAG TPA: hypothetical protein V6D17_07015, partial [Candidatus Obscuribacterales bacterium]